MDRSKVSVRPIRDSRNSR